MDYRYTWKFRWASRLEFFLRNILFPPYYLQKDNHFPLLIKTEAGDIIVCESVHDLPHNRAFWILANNREIVI